MQKKRLLIFLFISLIAIALHEASAFEFNGTVYDINGFPLDNATINITVRNVAGWTIVGYNATTSNSSGWFNITVPENAQWMYEPKITHKNSSDPSTNYTDSIGQSLPAFPSFMYSGLSGTNFYLRDAGTINITAINASGQFIAFNYQVKDTKLGYSIASEFTNMVTQIILTVPRDRNYSIMIYPNQSMPVSFEWNNFSTTNSYTIVHSTAGSRSRYNATTKTLHKQFNTTMQFVFISGFANHTLIANQTAKIGAGWQNINIIPYMFEPGNIVHATHGDMPFNMSAFSRNGVNNQSDFTNLTTGFYNITIPAPAESANIMLFAVARNGSNYYGGFLNITTTYGAGDLIRNFTLYGLLGVASKDRNISMTDAASFEGAKKNITTAMQAFDILNSTNSTLDQISAHIEATVDYTNFGATEFTWVEYLPQGSTSIFYLPLLNTTGIKEMNVFVNGGNYAPKRKSYTVSDISSNNLTNKNITVSSFNPQSIDSAISASNILMQLFISNVTCDIPVPPAGCQIGSSDNMQEHNPMGAIMGGGKLSFRMGTAGILVHYVNVDMMASGPPDALFDDSTSTSTSGNSFDAAVRFGSGGPTVYDYILISIPYSETAGSGLDDSQQVNISIPHLYDDNWNIIWNATANGTSGSSLANNQSHYSTYSTQWEQLMNGTTCHTNDTLINTTNPCYKDTSNNRIWIRLPHFSGTGPNLDGSLVAATTTTTAGSSGSSSSGNVIGKSGNTEESKDTDTETSEAADQTIPSTPLGSTVEIKSPDPVSVRGTAGTAKSFTLDGTVTHKITFKSITDKAATVIFESEPVEVTLEIGETKQVDLDQDQINDIEVTLNKIVVGEAD